MRILILLLFFAAHWTLVAQTERYAGTYGKRSESSTSQTVLAYTLNLKPDGTFFVHIYRNLDPSQPEENWFGKGTWIQEAANTLIFYTNIQTDLDEKFTLNFTNTKARSNRKSDRNNSKEIVQQSIRFFQSDIIWFKGVELLKKD